MFLAWPYSKLNMTDDDGQSNALNPADGGEANFSKMELKFPTKEPNIDSEKRWNPFDS